MEDNNLKNVLGDFGFTISENNEPQETEQLDPQLGEDIENEEEDYIEPFVFENKEAVAEEQPTEESSLTNDTKDTEENIEPSVSFTDENVIEFLNEKFGLNIDSLETLIQTQEEPLELDAELEAVLKFKQETGKSLSDYYLYQQLDTSEMGDADAVKLKFQLEYPELSAEERDLLIADTYKLDEDIFSESEIRLGKVRLKADAARAKNEINKVRELYSAPAKPEATQEPETSVFDDGWFGKMESTVDNLESLEFELGDGQKIDFKVQPNYKHSLKQSNKSIENYFDQYVDKKGNWNHELFNMHRAALENIESIVKTAYHQGLSNGQKKVVETASNVKSETPQVSKTNPDAQEAFMEWASKLGKRQGGGLVVT